MLVRILARNKLTLSAAMPPLPNISFPRHQALHDNGIEVSIVYYPYPRRIYKETTELVAKNLKCPRCGWEIVSGPRINIVSETGISRQRGLDLSNNIIPCNAFLRLDSERSVEDVAFLSTFRMATKPLRRPLG